MLTTELIECKRCGNEVRRKRQAQRYCSEQCRNASVQDRKRRKRSGDKESPKGPQKRRLLPPYLEAVTGLSKSKTTSKDYGGQKRHPYPSSLIGGRPVVDLTGNVSPELLAFIAWMECGA